MGQKRRYRRPATWSPATLSDPVPSASHTYGYSVSGMVSDAADAFSEAGRQFSQWTYDQVGRPYDAPDQ